MADYKKQGSMDCTCGDKPMHKHEAKPEQRRETEQSKDKKEVKPQGKRGEENQ